MSYGTYSAETGRVLMDDSVYSKICGQSDIVFHLFLGGGSATDATIGIEVVLTYSVSLSGLGSEGG